LARFFKYYKSLSGLKGQVYKLYEMALIGKLQASILYFALNKQHFTASCYIAPHKILTSILLSILISYSPKTRAQTGSIQGNTQTVIAGKQFDVDKVYQALWGRHYRAEWATPVTVPVINLDTTAGGLTPVRLGGGRQTKTLHLVNDKGKSYVLRSVVKDFSSELPDIYGGSFVESIARDQTSIAHPYAALTVPKMIKAAGIYHTNPKIVFVPYSNRLGVYNINFGNTLCLFEERPDGNQEDASNFGNSKNVVATDDLFENLSRDHKHQVDQLSFVRARLFDMFAGDWGRHEDQWRWATFEEEERTVYKPIPRDRDQLYTKFDGGMLAIALKAAGLGHLESFNHTITNVPEFNFPARHLDRKLTNKATRQQWLDIAKDLQQSLTDPIIEEAIRKLPPEVFPISGNEIIDKLKSRRNHLPEFAEKYYNYLASKIDITGTIEKDLFEVEHSDEGATSVKIFGFNKDGVESKPYYYRTFFPKETDEIRLYGLDEADIFKLQGGNKNKITVRIIPGPGADSINEVSVSKGKTNTYIYDTEGSGFQTSGKVHISNDSLMNVYHYRIEQLGKHGFTMKPGNRLGIGYRIRKEKWGKRPFGVEHSLIGYYTITRNGLALEYRTILPQLIGRWNFEVGARAEFPFVVHFFGVGNNTVRTHDTNRFYRMSIHELNAGFAINRLIDSTHFIEVRPFYQTIKIKNEEDKFIGKESGIPPDQMARKYFAGAEAAYQFRKTNHLKAPTRGIHFFAGAGYTYNTKISGRSFARYASSLAFYFPVLHNFSLAVRAGGATINGKAEFYQLNRLGGNENLRGHLRERFYGKTIFYNNNELRWLLPIRSYFFNGTIGLLGFVDNGRVWHPGETSDKWHTGYGPGIVLAPFNKLWLNASYGISSDDTVFHLQVGFFF
jgi:hypothetical protein